MAEPRRRSVHRDLDSDPDPDSEPISDYRGDTDRDSRPETDTESAHYDTDPDAGQRTGTDSETDSELDADVEIDMEGESEEDDSLASDDYKHKKKVENPDSPSDVDIISLSSVGTGVTVAAAESLGKAETGSVGSGSLKKEKAEKKDGKTGSNKRSGSKKSTKSSGSSKSSTKSSSKKEADKKGGTNAILEGASMLGNFDTGQLTVAGATMVLSNVCLGPMIQDLPYQFYEAGGIVNSLPITVAVLILAVGGITIMVRCAERTGAATYQDIMRLSCGRFPFYMACVFVTLFCYSICVRSLIGIGDVWDKLYDVRNKPCHWYSDKELVMLCVGIVILLPLCFSRKITMLVVPSGLALLCVAYYMLVALNEITHMPELAPPEEPMITYVAHFGWTRPIMLGPQILLVLQVLVYIVPVMSAMPTEDKTKIHRPIILGIVLTSVMSLITGTLGFLTFRSEVDRTFILSFSPKTHMVAAWVALGIDWMMAFPVAYFIARLCIGSVLLDLEVKMSERAQLALDTVAPFFFILVISVLSPRLLASLPIARGVAAHILLTFPGACLLQRVVGGHVVAPEKKCQWAMVAALALFYIAVGVFMFVLSLTEMVVDDIHHGVRLFSADICSWF